MMIEFLKDVIPVCLVGFLLLAMVCLPIVWFDGHAKSSWIKQSRGIELPWYEATWLDIEINSVDGQLQIK